MSLKKAILACVSVVAFSVSPSGKGTAGVRMRIRDETAPAGGMVQMKVLSTEVTPISGGRPRFAFDQNVFDGVAGFSLFNANGEAAGAAVIDGNDVQVSYVTTAPETGDYPVITVTLPIRPDAVADTSTLFTLDPRSAWTFWNTGADTARISPATVTVGGSVSITDVVPGEGVVPAGTVVSVRGLGFSSQTQLQVAAPTYRDVRVVSPTELQFMLSGATNMTGLHIRATNPDNSRATYLAYMRGITTTLSARTLLAMTEPIFAVTPRAVATLGPIATLWGHQYAALAFQNPNAADVTIDVSLYADDGTLLYETARTLVGRHRVALEVSELLDGVAPPAGSSIVVNASAPIDAISLLCDEKAWTVSPSLPLEARR